MPVNTAIKDNHKRKTYKHKNNDRDRVLLSPLQRSNLLNLNEEIRKKRTILDSYPLSMSVILEGRGCNMGCIYCVHWWGDKVKGYTYGTPMHLIKDMKNFIPYLRTLSFGGSEPLIYKEWYYFLDMIASNPNLRMSLSTNGMALNKETVKKICSANFAWIRFSIDAALPKTYSAIRLNGRISHILKACEWIHEYKKGIFPKIQWNFVIMKMNFKQIPVFIDLANKFGVERVNFKMLIPSELANSKIKQDYQEMTGFKQVDLFDQDISRDFGLSCLLLEYMAEARRKCKQYGIQMLDTQVMPYILKHQPNFKERMSSISDRKSRENMHIGRSRKSIIAFYEDLESDIPDFYRITSNVNGKKFYTLKDLIDRHFPDCKTLYNDTPVLCLDEVIEKSKYSCSLLGEKTGVESLKEVNSRFQNDEKEQDNERKDFFCMLPFTNMSWGEYRFRACCYAKPQFSSFTKFSADIKSLRDIWNSVPYQRMRQLMYSHKPDDLCKNTCPYYSCGGNKVYLSQKNNSR